MPALIDSLSLPLWALGYLIVYTTISFFGSLDDIKRNGSLPMATGTILSAVIVSLMVICHYNDELAKNLGHGILVMFLAGLTFESYSLGVDLKANIEAPESDWIAKVTIAIWLILVLVGYGLGLVTWLKHFAT